MDSKNLKIFNIYTSIGDDGASISKASINLEINKLRLDVENVYNIKPFNNNISKEDLDRFLIILTAIDEKAWEVEKTYALSTGSFYWKITYEYLDGTGKVFEGFHTRPAYLKELSEEIDRITGQKGCMV